MSLKSTRAPGCALVAMGAALLLAACTDIHQSRDFERHRFSQLVVPYDRNDVVYFDVTFSPDMPDQNDAAEARRMEWLESWLAARKLCPAGYDILARRPFDFLEDNPARHDLRYVVSCASAPDA